MNRPLPPKDLEPFAVTTGSLPASLKVYSAPPGEEHARLQVPFREVATGEGPFRLYDPSGPYTDPRVSVDVSAGLAPLRAEWIAERGDARVYFGRKTSAPTSSCPSSPTSARRSRASPTAR
jgi:phosphomethylpyrimidine synthase